MQTNRRFNNNYQCEAQINLLNITIFFLSSKAGLFCDSLNNSCCILQLITYNYTL
jgi:hypothetical protein